MMEQLRKKSYINNKIEMFQDTKAISEYLTNKPRAKTCFWRRNQQNSMMGQRITFLEVETAVSSFLSLIEYLNTQGNMSDEEKGNWLGGNNVKEGVLLNLDKIIRYCDGYINARKTLFFRERRDRREFIKKLRDVLKADRASIAQTQGNDILTKTGELLLKPSEGQLDYNKYFEGPLVRNEVKLESLERRGGKDFKFLAIQQGSISLRWFLENNAIKIEDLKTKNRKYGFSLASVTATDYHRPYEYLLGEGIIKLQELGDYGLNIDEDIRNRNVSKRIFLEADSRKYGFSMKDSLQKGYVDLEDLLREGYLKAEDLGEAGRYGFTLQEALEAGYVPLWKLVDKGYVKLEDLKNPDKYGFSLLDAIRGGYARLESLVPMRIKVEDLKNDEKYGFSLKGAVQGGHVTLKELFANKIISVKNFEQCGFTLIEVMDGAGVTLLNCIKSGGINLEDLKNSDKYGFSLMDAMNNRRVGLWDLLEEKVIKPEDLKNAEKYGFSLLDAIRGSHVKLSSFLSISEVKIEDLQNTDKYGLSLKDAVWAGHLNLRDFLENDKKNTTVKIEDLQNAEKYGFSLLDAVQDQHLKLHDLIGEKIVKIEDLQNAEKYGFSLLNAVRNEYLSLLNLIEKRNITLNVFEQYGFNLTEEVRSARLNLEWLLEKGAIGLGEFGQYNFNLREEVHAGRLDLQWLFSRQKIRVEDFQQYDLNLRDEVYGERVNLGWLLENKTILVRQLENYDLRFVDEINNGHISVKALLQKDIINIEELRGHGFQLLQLLHDGKLDLKELLTSPEFGGVITMDDLEGEGRRYEFSLQNALDGGCIALEWLFQNNLITLNDLRNNRKYGFNLRDAVDWQWTTEATLGDITGDRDRIRYILNTLDPDHENIQVDDIRDVQMNGADFYNMYKDEYAYSLAEEWQPDLEDALLRQLNEYRDTKLNNDETLKRRYTDAAGTPSNPDVKEVRAILNYQLKQKMKMGFTDKFYKKVEFAWRRVNVEYPDWKNAQQKNDVFSGVKDKLIGMFDNTLTEATSESEEGEALSAYYLGCYSGSPDSRIEQLSVESYKTFQKILTFLLDYSKKASEYTDGQEREQAGDFLMRVRVTLGDNQNACVGRVSEIINVVGKLIDEFTTKDKDAVDKYRTCDIVSQYIRDRMLENIKLIAAGVNNVHETTKFPNTFGNAMNFSQVNTRVEGGLLQYDWYSGTLGDAITLMVKGFINGFENDITTIAADILLGKEWDCFKKIDNLTASEYIKFRGNHDGNGHFIDQNAIDNKLQEAKTAIEALKDTDDETKPAYPKLILWLAKDENVTFKEAYAEMAEGCFIEGDIISEDAAKGFRDVFPEFTWGQNTGKKLSTMLMRILLCKEGYMYYV